MKTSLKKIVFIIFVMIFFASPFCVRAAGNGLNLTCTSNKVKVQFSCDTLRIVENHLNDFDATNFNSRIASYGGFENYAKSVGGIFGQYYGKKIGGRTEADFQTALEYVLGWMYMYGWDYMNDSGSHTSCSGKDCFYSNGGFVGKYNSDPNFDHVISGANGGPGRMASECGDLEVFAYNKMGISRNKQLPKVSRLRDLKVGDAVYFFNHKVSKTDANESDWGIGRHNVIVGEVYSDHLVFYDTGPVYPDTRSYKKVIYFPNEAAGESDMDAIRKEYPHYDAKVDWGMRRFFNFSPSSSVSGSNSGKKGKFYCEFCTKDEDDPLYKKERQFYEKISIIKSIFGDRIDEVALAATVLHKYGDDYTYNIEYTEDFNPDTYAATWNGISSSQNQNFSDLFGDDQTKVKVSQNQKKMIEANEKVDLLTLAAIVMIDSNNGKYSDVCYRDGLAGNALVGNTKEPDFLSRFENGIFCGVLEVVPTPLDFISNLFSGDGLLVSGISTANRVVNTHKVCENGYVGGLYQNVFNVKNKSQKEALKRKTAQDIIDFSNYYKRLYGTLEEEKNTCTVNIAGSTGDFASWKQADSEWGSISLGGSSSVRNAGCLVTSISMQIARSGTKIGTLPSGYSEFNPGAFVTSLNDNGGFVGGGNFGWNGFNKIAPNWGVGDFVNLKTGDNKALADAVSKELSTGFGSENYQKFLVLQIHHAKSSQHWVAVNGVFDGKVTIFDPGGPSGTTLDENYDNWVVDGYRVMYAKDVSFGQTGTSNNNTCTSVISGGKGQGNIKIPQEYGAGGYTVTIIEEWNWAYDSGEQYEKWLASGAKYSNGIAVMNGRYLIACTNTFGKVGDEIDFFLDDGTKIPTIMFDTKDQTEAHGTPANKWGHGTSVLEFEVDGDYYYHKYGTNPGTGSNDWYKEWAGKRVASATNLTNGGISSSDSTISNTGSSNGTDGAVCVEGQAIGSDESNINNIIKVTCGKSSGTTNVLFVGNSKTSVNDIPTKFKKIAEANGYKVKVSTATQDAMTLQYMFENYNSVINQNYDCVVMQEQTDTYMNSDTSGFLSGVKNISEAVKKKNPSVMTYVRQTWSLKDDINFKAAFSNAETVADKTKSYLILDGKAFNSSSSSNPEINLLQNDGLHQTKEGAYLSAACIYNTLYGQKSSGTSYSAGLDSDVVSKLQATADSICEATELSSIMNYSNAVDIPDSVWKSRIGSGYDPSIVIADEEGHVLASRKPHLRRNGASTTKAFTGYAAVKLLDVNNGFVTGSNYVLSLDANCLGHDILYSNTKVSVSKAATRCFPGSSNTTADSIPIAIGYKYYNCSSDEQAFKKGMKKINELIRSIGCTDSDLYDGSGVHSSKNGHGHSANDLLLVTSAAMKDEKFVSSFISNTTRGSCKTMVQDKSKDVLCYIKSGTDGKNGHGIWGFNKDGKRYYISMLGITTNWGSKEALASDIQKWAINNLIK